MKRKILYLTAFVPCETAASEKNTMIMLEDLSRDYDVDLVYFIYNDQSEYVSTSSNIVTRFAFKNSLGFKLANVAKYPFIHPFFSVRYNSNILKQLKELVKKENYSAIIVNHSQIFLYGKALADGAIPVLCISHDVMAQRSERSSNKIVTNFCKYSERKALDIQNLHLFAFCQKDVDLLKEYYDIPSTVCHAYIDERIVNQKLKTIGDFFVLFGNWKRADNYEGAVWFFNELSKILNKPTVFKIIGKGFPFEKLKVNNPNLNIENLGFVDNPYPIIVESKAMICPIFSGAGCKQKVIESLACGVPVIGSEIAFEGFSELYNNFLLRCDSIEDYEKAINGYLFDLDQREDFRQMFIVDYQSETIPKYLNKLFANKDQ